MKAAAPAGADREIEAWRLQRQQGILVGYRLKTIIS